MRFILGVALAAGLATSVAAKAEMVGAVVPYSVVPPTPHAPLRRFVFPDLRDNYDRDLFLLKRKIDRMTRKDGGQLTPEHQASLQRKLDRLNRTHGRAVRQASL